LERDNQQKGSFQVQSDLDGPFLEDTSIIVTFLKGDSNTSWNLTFSATSNPAALGSEANLRIDKLQSNTWLGDGLNYAASIHKTPDD